MLNSHSSTNIKDTGRKAAIMADSALSTVNEDGGSVPAPSAIPDENTSQKSQTASDYIDSQLQLEADAREALPYNFDHCTQPLGPLRQSLFSCLTCSPPPSSSSDPFTPAAVCYSCSIACHGEHTLVELFNRRNFVCDCGTTRLPSTSPCTLRIDSTTGLKGPVHSQKPTQHNSYNKNFKNRFCACEEWYDPHQEKGTMFQCLGLAQEKDGGCGEDWWHPECVMGLSREKKDSDKEPEGAETDHVTGSVEDGDELEHPLPSGFPQEDDFETFICYKCVDANPWIKAYAGTGGFLPAVIKRSPEEPNGHSHTSKKAVLTERVKKVLHEEGSTAERPGSPKKRSADDAELNATSEDAKRTKSDEPSVPDPAYHASLPEPPSGPFSLFLREDFRDHFCRCRKCYPVLSKHPQLLEEEETYEPPLSDSENGGPEGSKGTGSLLDRGEAALSNVDRVRAIEGVMVYNHLKDKVKAFLQPYAESGQAVGAEDINAYFEKLRGDEQGMKEANAGSEGQDGNGEGDNRREEHGESSLGSCGRHITP